MRIAVCFYGQLRSALYSSCWIKTALSFPENFKFFKVNKQTPWDGIQEEEEEVSVDFFADIKPFSFEMNNTYAKKGVHTSKDIESINQIYSFKNFSITPEMLDKNISEGKPFYSKMFSSICRCVLMKQQHEIDNNFTYDVVILMRFDVLPGPSIDSVKNWLSYGVHPLSIYVNHTTSMRFQNEAFRSGFPDMFLYGDSLSMDLFASHLYPYWATNRIDDIKHTFMMGPNTFMYTAAVDAGLAIWYTDVQTAAVRTTADMSKNIFESWEYFKNYEIQSGLWNHPSD
jgi:hypothetical protein